MRRFGAALAAVTMRWVEFRMLRGGSRAISIIITSDFRKPNFGLTKDLFGEIPQVRALESREVQESWLLFKHHSPLCSRPVRPHEQETKQRRQETCVDEQGASSKTQMEEGSLQN